MLDGLAYYQIEGKEPSDLMKRTVRRMKYERVYEKIFIIENMGQSNKNAVRREDLEESLKLEKLQEENYREFGYEIISVPPGTVEERMLKVLANL